MAGIWPYKISARERLLVLRQAKNDDRNIRPLWFFVYNIEESPEDEIFLQTSKHLRVFLNPIPAYFYVEPEEDSEVVETGVDHRRNLVLTVSRAETFRLAGALRATEFKWTETRYRPRAQDVFQWRNDLYELQDTVQPKQFWGTTGIEALYSATATKLRLDSNAPGSPLVIQTSQPVLDYPRDFFRAEADGEEAVAYPHS